MNWASALARHCANWDKCVLNKTESLTICAIIFIWLMLELQPTKLVSRYSHTQRVCIFLSPFYFAFFSLLASFCWYLIQQNSMLRKVLSYDQKQQSSAANCGRMDEKKVQFLTSVKNWLVQTPLSRTGGFFFFFLSLFLSLCHALSLSLVSVIVCVSFIYCDHVHKIYFGKKPTAHMTTKQNESKTWLNRTMIKQKTLADKTQIF